MAPRPREREVEEDREDVVDVVDPNAKPDSMLKDDDDDEEDDGPDNAAARAQAKADAARRPAPKTVAADQDDEEDARLAYDEDEGDQERGAGGRRARRNRARRERDSQSAAQIAALSGRVQELQGHLEQMSRGQLSLAAGDIDGQIQTEQGRLAQINAALGKAVKEGDDVTYARAMELRDEARDRISQLGAERYRLAAVARQGQQPNPASRPAAAAAPDPTAARYSQTFMRRHDWFDPDNPADEDSQIVKAIDDALANEGYRSNTPLYWRELEKRVAARGLGKSDEGDEDVDDRDTDRDPTPQRRNGGMPPRSSRPSATRTGGRNTLKFDDTMKEVLESEGLLELKGLSDDQLKLRRKYVKSWSDGFKALEAGQRR